MLDWLKHGSDKTWTEVKTLTGKTITLDVEVWGEIPDEIPMRKPIVQYYQ